VRYTPTPQAQQLRDRIATDEKKSALATEYGISRETVYSYLRAEVADRAVGPARPGPARRRPARASVHRAIPAPLRQRRSGRSRSRRVVAGRRAYGVAGEPEPVAGLGIDEVHRGKPHRRFDELAGSWTTTADRWHVGFADLSGGQGLLAQVEGRTTAAVAGWLAARPQAWRAQVKAVAIDICALFKAAIRQVPPHALLVVDHLHVVQLANRAVTEVSRRVTLVTPGRVFEYAPAAIRTMAANNDPNGIVRLPNDVKILGSFVVAPGTARAAKPCS
jgi:hypothetical protein